MSINTWLLATFTSSSRPGADVKSLLAGYQSLAIIYVNLFILSCMIPWKFIDWFISPLPGNIVIVTTTPLAVLSLYLLKKEKRDFSAVTALSLLQLGNFLSSNISRMSLGAAYSLSFFPGVAFFLTSSAKVQTLNIVLCFLQNIGHTIKIQNTFRVTFTDEQAAEILGVQLLSFTSILFGWILFYLQKSIETKLWNLAQTNFEKSENITKEVMQAIKSKDTFVSSLSHEIRNPLNSMNGSIDYLLKTVKEQSYIKVLNTAKLSGEILLNLVNNALDAAKLTAEKMELCYMETEVTDIIKKVLAVNSENLRKKDIFAEGFISKGLSPILWTDPSRLLQIIMNLVSNAIKFTPKEGKVHLYLTWQDSDSPASSLLEPVQSFLLHRTSSETTINFQFNSGPSLARINTQIFPIPTDRDIQEFDQTETKWRDYTRYFESKKKSLAEVNYKYTELTENFNVWSMYKASASLATKSEDNFRALEIKRNTSLRKKGFLKVQVSDTGSGIAQDDIHRVFEMFSQINQGISSIDGGSGLGLWICKQLCKKMGGDITLYSELDKGTSVVFYIPIDNDPLSMNGLPKAPSKEKVRVLVVDDYAYNRDVHQLILEKEGVEVTLACNGLEAFEKYKAYGEDYFDFVMMDIQMPVMDGFTAAKKIREWENANNRKTGDIYFVSGEYYSEAQIINELEESRVKINGRTGIRCLRKPIDVGIIKQIIGQYKL